MAMKDRKVPLVFQDPKETREIKEFRGQLDLKANKVIKVNLEFQDQLALRVMLVQSGHRA
jgi:hypothetical protein